MPASALATASIVVASRSGQSVAVAETGVTGARTEAGAGAGAVEGEVIDFMLESATVTY